MTTNQPTKNPKTTVSDITNKVRGEGITIHSSKKERQLECTRGHATRRDPLISDDN